MKIIKKISFCKVFFLRAMAAEDGTIIEKTAIRNT